MEFINAEQIVKLLSNLIRIKSVYLNEADIMAYTHEFLKNQGLDAELQTYEENKILNYTGKNVIGRLVGKSPGPKIYLNGHLDTVQLTKGWHQPPLEPVVIDDRLYGLGSLDMKSGVVAIILALLEFKKDYPTFKGEICYSFVSDEEGPFGLGTDAVLKSGFANDSDIAIVTEPSSGFSHKPFPTLALGARGGVSYEVEFFGQSAHGANPEEGNSALVAASQFVIGLKNEILESDGILGPGSNCIIEMNGGGATCSVADYGRVKVFRHLNTKESPETVKIEVQRVIEKAGVICDYKMHFRKSPSKSTDGFLPYVFKKENPVIESFVESIVNVTGEEPRYDYFSSIGDFNYIGSRLKVPTLVFGPYGENYHGPNEYVTISSVLKTSEVLYDYFKRLLL